MARPKGIIENKPRRRPPGDEYEDKNQLTDEMITNCIQVYLNTGNMAAVGRSVGRTRMWAIRFFRSPRVIEAMKMQTLQLRGNGKVASIEECMSKLTEIMRGQQLTDLADRVRKSVESKADSVIVADAIDKLTRFTPQVESNQIKATTMLLTAQGALDPNRTANEDHQAVVDQIVLELLKSEGSVDAILEGIKKGTKIEVIDVTPE